MNSTVAPRTLIDSERLKADIPELAEIGRDPAGGITRLAYSAEEARARRWLADRFAQLDLAVQIDAAGNLIARRAGTDATAPVLTGSHVDTVPQGGRFDGAAGALAALEVARTLDEENVTTRRPIEFVVFAAEESPRFTAAHRFGSRAMAGQVSSEDADALVDDDGITVTQAMTQRGLAPERLADARRRPGDIAAFLELHIEQGTTLAQAGIPVGIVTSIAGTRRYRITLDGQPAHSGGTPMDARQDALAAGAEVVLAMEQIATEIGGTLVGTVTMLTVTPNAMNVVPGRSVLGVDIRDTTTATIDEAGRRLIEAIEAICDRRRVTPTIRQIRDTAPMQLSERIQRAVDASAARAGIPIKRVSSHTGHDVISLSDITDVGMIFVRNPSGRSHSPDESVQWDDLALATQVLLETMLTLAGDVDG